MVQYYRVFKKRQVVALVEAFDYFWLVAVENGRVYRERDPRPLEVPSNFVGHEISREEALAWEPRLVEYLESVKSGFVK